MVKKIVVALLIAITLFIIFHDIPIIKKVDFSMSGSLRNTKGEIVVPCSLRFIGHDQSYLRKGDPVLKGTLSISGSPIFPTAHVFFPILSVPDEKLNGDPEPFGILNCASGPRYDSMANGFVNCSIFFTDDRSTYVIVDNETIYCFSTLSESEFLEIFNMIKQFAKNNTTLNPNT